MAKQPKSPEPPKEQPVVPPAELYASYDIRLVMHKLGEIGSQVADLREGQKEAAAKQAKIDEKLIRFDTTIKVAAGGIVAFLGFFWFMFGGDIRALRDMSIRQQAGVVPASNSQDAVRPAQPIE